MEGDFIKGCNAFGRQLLGKDWIHRGADPNTNYYAAFRIICMGDRNAVSLAQAMLGKQFS